MTVDPAVPFFMVFTDLDGTLLDHNTYGWEDALPALDLCKRLFVPVILVSSKTRAEMDLLRRSLSLSAPFISENGGGIFSPVEAFDDPPPGANLDKGLWKWSLGLSYDRIVSALKEIRSELGWNIKGFSEMGIEEISRLTGLDEESTRLATMREYDEPFIILEEQPPDCNLLFQKAARRGLTVTTGGRFHHIQGKNDKAQAMKKVISWYRNKFNEVFSIALGDSPNDFSMLECADYPVLVRSERDFSMVKNRIPGLKITREMGPKGWNTAVLDFLQHKEEQHNARQASQRD